MKRDLRVYLDDILEAIELIEDYTKDISEQEFRKNTQLQDAVIRRFAIIGEAIKNIPQEFKEKNKKIPWQEISGMRNILVHEYFGVRIERIWKTIKEDLPVLKQQFKH